jgi:hypothetical protein
VRLNNCENHKTRAFVSPTRETALGGCRIAGKISAGGAGEVYPAEDTRPKRQIVPTFKSSPLVSGLPSQRRDDALDHTGAIVRDEEVVTYWPTAGLPDHSRKAAGR